MLSVSGIRVVLINPGINSLISRLGTPEAMATGDVLFILFCSVSNINRRAVAFFVLPKSFIDGASNSTARNEMFD